MSEPEGLCVLKKCMSQGHKRQLILYSYHRRIHQQIMILWFHEMRKDPRQNWALHLYHINIRYDHLQPWKCHIFFSVHLHTACHGTIQVICSKHPGEHSFCCGLSLSQCLCLFVGSHTDSIMLGSGLCGAPRPYCCRTLTSSSEDNFLRP